MEPLSSDQTLKHLVVVGIVDKIKAEGVFDTLRKECLADVDTKPAYQNLKQKVESACARFLSRIPWSSGLNKNLLREQLRANITDSGFLEVGVARIVNQVVKPKIDQDIRSKLADVVSEYLGVDPNPPEEPESIQHDLDNTLVVDVTKPPPSISLFPFNPYEPPPPLASAAPPLPGFDAQPPPPDQPEPPPPPSDQQKEEDRAMDISSNSGSEGRPVDTKEDDNNDMDCTMSDEEGRDAGDLAHGLAAYMSESTGDPETVNPEPPSEDDAMSISTPSTESSRPASQATSHNDGESENKHPEASDGKDIEQSRKKKLSPLAPVLPVRESRRQRTRNRKYLSEDFTSIFTERTDLLSEGYSSQIVTEEVILDEVQIESTVVETLVELGEPSNPDVVASAGAQLEQEALSTDQTFLLEGEKEDRPASVASNRTSGSDNSSHSIRRQTSAASQHYDPSDLYKPRRSSRLSRKSTLPEDAPVLDPTNVSTDDKPTPATNSTEKSQSSTVSNTRRRSARLRHIDSPAGDASPTETISEESLSKRELVVSITDVNLSESSETMTRAASASGSTPTMDEIEDKVNDETVAQAIPTEPGNDNEDSFNMSISPETVQEEATLTAEIVQSDQSAIIIDNSKDAESLGATDLDTISDIPMPSNDEFSTVEHNDDMDMSSDEGSVKSTGSKLDITDKEVIQQVYSPDKCESPSDLDVDLQELLPVDQIPIPVIPTGDIDPDSPVSLPDNRIDMDSSLENYALKERIYEVSISQTVKPDSGHSGSPQPDHSDIDENLEGPSSPLVNKSETESDMDLASEGERLSDDGTGLKIPISSPQTEPQSEPEVTGYASESRAATPADGEGEIEPGEDYDEKEIEELERLAKRKMEILKSIEIPDRMDLPSKRQATIEESSEEEGEITDSDDSDRETRRKKSKKKSSKKKKKKESKKRRRSQREEGEISSSKRSRYWSP